MKPQITWILLADGGQARVLAHSGPGKGLEGVSGLKFSHDPISGQELATGLQGGPGSEGAHGVGAETRNGGDKSESAFVKGVAERLSLEHRNGRFDRLVIAAAPKALADIRQALSPQVKEIVMAELPKDLTNTPSDKLGAHFDGILAV